MEELKKENLDLSYKLRELQVELHSALKNYQNTSQLLEQKGNESSRLQRIISDLETKNKRVNEMLGKDMAHRAVNFQSKVEQMLQKPRSQQRIVTEPDLNDSREISPYRPTESIKMLERIVDL
mgnify:CR=1 FL=1